ncbi:hypothetical protein RIF29_32590 [Crotalaria pallida]|uniref:Uncharacterized protein n=1 Tax=Crotalaria pallida TaxID=3830 RepID=A0AAN9EKL2_CROPI
MLTWQTTGPRQPTPGFQRSTLIMVLLVVWYLLSITSQNSCFSLLLPLLLPLSFFYVLPSPYLHLILFIHLC